jgi:hypothetical protein
MMKTIVWVLVLGVVIFGIYSLSGKNKINYQQQVASENLQEQSVEEEKPTGKKMAFSEFVKQGGAYQCSVKQATSDFDSSGTVYINGSKMRGEFTTIAEGINVKSYIIMRDGFIYTWSSAAPKIGFKMEVKTDEQSGNSGTYTWDPKQIGDYDCSVWTVDEAKFTVPSEVTFSLAK